MKQVFLDDYGLLFKATLLEIEEVVVPPLEAETFVEQGDKTREFVQALIQEHGLVEFVLKGRKLRTVGCGRWTEEHGNHYWVTLWEPGADPPQSSTVAHRYY